MRIKIGISENVETDITKLFHKGNGSLKESDMRQSICKHSSGAGNIC